MDVDVDNLSDAELRSKLTEFGLPVMPITGTTRKTMVKKLKMLLENKEKIGRRDQDKRRTMLGRYSSEEESDSDSKTKKEKNRRITMAASAMQPPLINRKKASSRNELDFGDPPKREVKTVTTSSTRTTKILEQANNEFDTGSESDEVAEKYDRGGGNYRESSSSRKPSSPTGLPSSFISANRAMDAAESRLSQIRSRHSSSFNTSYSSPSTDDLLKDKGNTPFLSNFTKSLSQIASPKPDAFGFKSDIIKENDVNGGTSRAYLSSFRTTRGRPNTFDYKSPQGEGVFKNNFVPFTVLAVAFIFFVLVAIVYMGIRSDTSLEVTAKIPICDPSEANHMKRVNCVTKEEDKPAFHLLELLLPELQRRALRNACESGEVKPYMTEGDVVSTVKDSSRIKDEQRIFRDLENIEVLSFFNPSWGIAVLHLKADGDNFDDTHVAKSMEQVIKSRTSQVIALVFLNPTVPWKCYVFNALWSFSKYLIVILAAVVVLYLLKQLYKLYRQIRLKSREEELAIVENIVEILQANAAENDVNYMVINHVRDMILPINERMNKQKVWARAVKYVHENESRIRTEEREVQGEVSEIWRWIGGASLNSSKNKSWQGQAFETQVGSVNSLPCSPTPCLKIRGMVEEGDRNTLVIKKAVLSKCAHECRILHCAVDLNSKCVYLKCADTSDAAVAYRNLHGWWYSGNLVTVKYLRLERYMQRFPDSPHHGPPFLQ